MTENGKGSSPRPIIVDRKTYEDNWERVFGREGTEEIDDVVKQVQELPQEIVDKLAELNMKADQLSTSIKETHNVTPE